MMAAGEIFSLLIYLLVIILFVSNGKKARKRRMEMLEKGRQQREHSPMETRMHELFPEEKMRQTKDRLKQKYADYTQKQTSASSPASSSASSKVFKEEAPAKTDSSYIRKTPAYIPPRHAGKRHEVWDEVPNGCFIKVCGYCGAENAVPFGTAERYSCYFCREELQ